MFFELSLVLVEDGVKNCLVGNGSCNFVLEKHPEGGFSFWPWRCSVKVSTSKIVTSKFQYSFLVIHYTVHKLKNNFCSSSFRCYTCIVLRVERIKPCVWYPDEFVSKTIYFVQFPWALSVEGPTFQIALESALGGFVMQIRRAFS